MKGNLKSAGLLTLCSFITVISLAQQKIQPGALNYLIGVKPNNILYRDTLYRGSREFRQLFYRTGDHELIRLYKKHQTAKIASQMLSFAGAFAIGFGIGNVSSGDSDAKTRGWILIGGGFLMGTYGGYLNVSGQQRLQMAAALFNSRYNKAALGIGTGDHSLGLVYKF